MHQGAPLRHGHDTAGVMDDESGNFVILNDAAAPRVAAPQGTVYMLFYHRVD
jgi:hypothetical protein